MRLAASAAVLLIAAGLSSCAAPSGAPAETAREDSALSEASLREWVQAIELGMAQARLDLARRAVRRMFEAPG